MIGLERSETAVCNLALSRLLQGYPPVTDAATDTSDQATLFRRIYPLARDATLRETDWNFASRRQSLAAYSVAPIFGFDKQFPLPADYIALREIDGVGETDEYVIESLDGIGRMLLVNRTGPLKIRYTASVDLGFWDEASIDALVARCATDMAFSLTGEFAVARDMSLVYGNRLENAKSKDAMEGTSNTDVAEGSWVQSRWL